MTPILRLDDPSLLAAVRSCVDVHDELRHEEAGLAAELDSLLRAGWTGPAADDYSAAWEQWQAGCREVLAALAATAATMTAVAARLHGCDDAQDTAIALVRARLGGAR